MVLPRLFTFRAIACCFLSCVAAHRAAAQEWGRLSLRSGVFEVDKHHETFEGGLEYCYPWWHVDHEPLRFELAPQVGLAATADGAIYGYSGFRAELLCYRQIVVSPAFSAGGYDKGRGKDLGGHFQFRSGLDLGYRFANDIRVMAGFHHLSNAGLNRRNPGANSVLLTCTFCF